jgi:hypothetical protein
MHIHFAFSIRKRLADVPNNSTEDATLLVKYFDEAIQNRKVKSWRQHLPSRSPQITLKIKLKPWLKPEYLKHNKLFFSVLTGAQKKSLSQPWNQLIIRHTLINDLLAA